LIEKSTTADAVLRRLPREGVFIPLRERFPYFRRGYSRHTSSYDVVARRIDPLAPGVRKRVNPAGARTFELTVVNS
jgi:hypothetical protein